MIDFSNQQIRDNIAPVFQPPDTDYAGRMRDVKECEVGQYSIKPKEFSDVEIPPDIQEIIDADPASLAPPCLEILPLSDYGWKIGDEPLEASRIQIGEGVLYLCIKDKDLPHFSVRVKNDKGTYEDVVVNDTDIVWAYKEKGEVFISFSKRDEELPTQYRGY